MSDNVFPFTNIIELEKNIEDRLTKIRSITYKANPLIIMVQLHVLKFFKYLGDIETSVHGNISPFENKMLDITQSLIVSSDVNTGTRCLDKNEINEYMDLLESLFTAATMYVYLAEKDDLIKYSQGMQMNVS